MSTPDIYSKADKLAIIDDLLTRYNDELTAKHIQIDDATAAKMFYELETGREADKITALTAYVADLELNIARTTELRANIVNGTVPP